MGMWSQAIHPMCQHQRGGFRSWVLEIVSTSERDIPQRERNLSATTGAKRCVLSRLHAMPTTAQTGRRWILTVGSIAAFTAQVVVEIYAHRREMVEESHPKLI